MKTNNYSGWIFIDKSEGKTSFDVIRSIKKILQVKKIFLWNKFRKLWFLNE